MKPYTKMMLMNQGRKGGSAGMNDAYNRVTNRNVGGRPMDDRGGKVYDRPMEDNYGPENRRDSRGRYAPRNEMENRYENAYNGGQGAGYPTDNYRMGHDGGWVVKPIEDRMEGNYGPENRRDRMGRYAPKNESPESWMPPYWENRMDGGQYRVNEDGGRMIGFDGNMDNRMRMNHGHHEGMEHMHMGGSREEGGHHKLDQRTAVEWVNKMENSDGSRGEHFTMEQTERIRKNKNWDCDPLEFWVAMNAMWSDGAATAKKYNMDKIEYWADRAKEFIMDKDAGPGKMARYYKYIVKHE